MVWQCNHISGFFFFTSSASLPSVFSTHLNKLVISEGIICIYLRGRLVISDNWKITFNSSSFVDLEGLKCQKQIADVRLVGDQDEALCHLSH